MICKYWQGKNPEIIEENNSDCGRDGQNCDYPFNPCYICEDGEEL